MRTLFIDLASHHGCLAAVADGACVAMLDVDHRIDDADVLPLLEQLLQDARWEKNDIGRIACASGPGGFTSLRVAVTLANTLADQLQVPLAGVHVSDVYWTRMPSLPSPLPQAGEGWRAPASRGEGVFWLHSTRSTHLFIRGGAWNEPTLIATDDLKRLPAGSLWMGELLPAHRAIVDAQGCTEVSFQPLANVLPAILDDLPYDTKQIVPWYGRGW